jgi:2-polyprenyl-6-methoxyphenol hydroxylase-like FAD-dependent oxidoreductase
MKADVSIGGAGSIDLTIASELARYGFPVRIVDKSTRRTDESKAIVVWSRTLELLDRLGPGVVERFVHAGLKTEYTNIFADEERIAHVHSPMCSTQRAARRCVCLGACGTT